MNIKDLPLAHAWRPIPNCPGRYVLQDSKSNLTPQQIAGVNHPSYKYRVDAARDIVEVLRLTDGGLISYLRDDGSYVHTLNTVAGWRRKLQQLGLEPSDSSSPGKADAW